MAIQYEQEEKATETVNIKPNYKSLFAMFLRDFEIYGSNLNSLSLESHEKVQRVLTTFNVAFHSITEMEDLEILRESLSNVIEKSGESLRSKELAEETN